MLDITDKGNQCLSGLLFPGYKQTVKVLRQHELYDFIPQHINIFYIPNPTQYLNLTTTFLTINKQQIKSLLRQKS